MSDIRDLLEEAVGEYEPRADRRAVEGRIRRHGRRRRIAAGGLGLFVFVLGGALAFRAFSPSSDGNSAAEDYGTYILSDFTVAPAVDTVTGEEVPGYVLVEYQVSWSTSEYPGDHECELTVFDADGAVVGSNNFQNTSMISGPHRSSLEVKVSGPAETATGQCAPERLDTPVAYEISDVEISHGLTVTYVVGWPDSLGEGEYPGHNSCTAALFESGELVGQRHFTLGVGQGPQELHPSFNDESVSAPVESLDATVACEPFIREGVFPDPKPAIGAAAPVAEVVCTVEGAEVITPVVALQADGLHVSVRNESRAGMLLARHPTNVETSWGRDLGAGDQSFVMRLEPGEFVLGCFAADGPLNLLEIPLTDFPASLTVVDPDGHWERILDEDTCGEELPEPVLTAEGPGTLADPLTGRLLVEAWSDEDRGDLLSVDADGSDVQPIFVGPGEHWDATWSPDRSQIAFVSPPVPGADGTWDAAVNDGEIFVMDADGNDLVQLTDNEAADDLITWSPDGSRILFRSNRDGNMGIYVMNADGSEQHALPIPGENADSTTWSPDGTRIAFVGTPAAVDSPGLCRDDDHELFVMDADGSNLVQLTDDELYEQSPAWSPDGSRIAFTASNQSDYAWDVFTIGIDGADLRRLTSHDGFDGQPVWSPDGSMIAFSSDRDASSEQAADNQDNDSPVGGIGLFVMNADGSAVQRLLDLEPFFGDALHEVFVAEWRAT